jgi:hypothetical protein
MPMGVLLLLGLAAAVTIAVSLWSRSAILRGIAGPRCGKCEYDLTGSVSNRCPECGSLFIDVGVMVPLAPPRLRKFRMLGAIAVIALLLLVLVAGLSTFLAFHQVRRARELTDVLSNMLRAAEARAAASVGGQVTTAPSTRGAE